MNSKPFILLLLLSIGSSCNDPQNTLLVTSDSDQSPILFQGANIFNGIDSTLLKDMDVLIKNGVIHEISTTIDPAGIENLRIVKATGQTLMPGLVDAHVHLSGSGAVPWQKVSADMEYNLSAYLYAGITTVYDLGGLAGDLSEISKKVDEKEVLGPTVFNTHIPITVEDGHPIPLTKELLFWPLNKVINLLWPTISETDEAKKVIEKYIDKDIDYIKIICDEIPSGTPEMSFELLKALIDEAHNQDKKVFVHVGSPQNAIDAVKARADVLAHGIWRGKLTEEQAEIIARSQTPIIYTIAPFHSVSNIYHGAYEATDFDRKLVPDEVLNPVIGSKGKDVMSQPMMSRFFKDVTMNSTYWIQNFKLLYKKGAPILVGTDSNLPGTYAGSSYYQELDVLESYGMTPYDVLKGATYRNARAFLSEPNFGSVEVAKRANLLLVEGNPLINLQTVKTPKIILLDGMIVNRN